MAYLDKLDITNLVIPAAKSRGKTHTKEYRSNKLIAALEEQIELARLAITGNPVQLQRKRGHTITTVKPRLWWNVDVDSTVFTQIRYNKIILNLNRQGTVIRVGKLRQLPTVYKTVIKAVKAGELDQVLENASKESCQ